MEEGTRIVICCGLKQINGAKRISDIFKSFSNIDVIIPKKDEFTTKALIDIWKDKYIKIRSASLIIFLTKEDGTIGTSVGHELAFTKFLGRPYLIVQPTDPIAKDDICVIFENRKEDE